MNCDDFQKMISKFYDGESSPDESANVFHHLGSCSQCRNFFHGLVTLQHSLKMQSDQYSAEIRLPSFQNSLTSTTWWHKRVAMSVPIFTVFITAIVISLAFLFSRNFSSPEKEKVFITRLPAVIVTVDTSASH